MAKEKDYWFPAKRPGMGWGWGAPVKWQGWVVFIGLLALLTVGSAVIASHSLTAFFIFLPIAVAALIMICMWKGEPTGGGLPKG